jgi:spoIIIJ-associated protein
MSDAMEFKGRTVEDAISEALLRLGARRDEIEIEVLDKGKAGLLGLFGGKPARVKVSRKVMRKTDGAARRDASARPRGGEERSRDSRDSRGRGREGRGTRDTQDTRNARGSHDNREPRVAAAAPAKGPVAGSVPGDRDRDRDGNAAAGGERTRRRRGGRGRGRVRSEGEGAPRVEPTAASSPPVAEAPRPFSPPAVIPTPTAPVIAVPPAVVPLPVAALPPAVSPLPPPAPSPSSVPVAVPPPAAAGFGALMAAAELVTPLRDVPEEEAPAAIQKLTAELMTRAGFPCRVDVRPGEYHAVRILTDESSAALLIGRNGATIDAIEHLVERMVSQAVGAHVHMNLDVNNYRRRREERLVQRAQEIAARVLRSGEQESLEALPARERRVVHLEVAKVSGVQTFTVMNEEGKHVVVAPAGATPPEGVATGSGADADHADHAEHAGGTVDTGAKPEAASGGRSDPPDAPAL